MQKLNFSYRRDIPFAYIIRISDNPISNELSERCATSCEEVGQPYEYFEAFTPTHTPISDSWVSWIKVVDPNLSPTEVACAFSHIALWAKCVASDTPLIILEHDAIVRQPFKEFPLFNCIVYLGCLEQRNSVFPIMPLPPHGSNGPDYHFMLRAHAYAIDPQIAKNMLAHVLKYGIHESLDIMLRTDIFPVIQFGFYAYEQSGETTITNRKKGPTGEER